MRPPVILQPELEGHPHELSRILGLPGKPEGIEGSEVERYVRDGRIKEVANYCETDVVNTYRIWLRYELFRGGLREDELRLSEQNLSIFIRAHASTKQHLSEVGNA